ncbi:PREDICTED: uncharacterized protein LOC109473288 [Branchiostoma belcheri]|uniref:Uncharacterized protein LOC109473288 n=1 Tax=Branchiostoma belcheri TaxID=7741 RepID=A0A6P4ZCA3_BRABE|nr:PREDICTED: uncharacterized protein LOC109473288 [Branchiostoma belcheri]
MASNSKECEPIEMRNDSGDEKCCHITDKAKQNRKARLRQFDTNSETEDMEATSGVYCLDSDSETNSAFNSSTLAWFEGSQRVDSNSETRDLETTSGVFYSDSDDDLGPKQKRFKRWHIYEPIEGRGDTEEITEQEYKSDDNDEYEEDGFVVFGDKVEEVILSESEEEAMTTSSEEDYNSDFFNSSNARVSQKRCIKPKQNRRCFRGRSRSTKVEPSHSPKSDPELQESPESPASPTDRGMYVNLPSCSN